MFDILDGFSLVLVPSYQQSKSTFLLVTYFFFFFELEYMHITNRYSQSDLAHCYKLHCLTNFAEGFNFLCYYVNVKLTPRRVVDKFHYSEQRLSWTVFIYFNSKVKVTCKMKTWNTGLSNLNSTEKKMLKFVLFLFIFSLLLFFFLLLN